MSGSDALPRRPSNPPSPTTEPMRTPRLYLAAELALGEKIELPPTLAHKLGRVLRLQTGREIILFNGDGRDYRARLEWHGRCALARIERSEDVRFREAPLALTLIQSLARGEKMDWIVQKATELGVQAIIPVASERSELRLEGERLERRLAHWQAVVAAACEQCGRAVLPAIRPPIALAELPRMPLPVSRLLLDPGGEDRVIASSDAACGIALAVGPEGGFSPAEERFLTHAGFVRWRLGPRILRTETAGLAAIATLLARYGDFAGAS